MVKGSQARANRDQRVRDESSSVSQLCSVHLAKSCRANCRFVAAFMVTLFAFTGAASGVPEAAKCSAGSSHTSLEGLLGCMLKVKSAQDEYGVCPASPHKEGSHIRRIADSGQVVDHISPVSHGKHHLPCSRRWQRVCAMVDIPARPGRVSSLLPSTCQIPGSEICGHQQMA